MTRIWLWVGVWLLALEAFAQGPVVIDMTVVGNRKVESEAILTILGTQKGEALDPELVREDIEELYALGYFSSIAFYQEPHKGGVLVTVEVTEKPAIVDIQFIGLEEISEDDFREKLEVKLYTIVNEAAINNDLRLIEKQYLEKGYFLATARYELEAEQKEGKDSSEVVLKYIVDEGGLMMVGDVFIEGNEYFSDKELISQFVSKPISRSSTFSAPGSVFNEEFLRRDVEFTSYLYKDQGFAEVKVSKPVVVMDKDRKFVRISFEVEEGIQYHVGGIDISGDILYPKEDMFEWMKLKEGDLFRFSYLRDDISMLMDKYGDKGFAFVDVNPIHRFDKEKKLVYLNYQIDKGQKVYFGDLLVMGNNKTRDNVIRREFEIGDSELYSGTRLTKSKKQVQRLGFFDEVQVISKRDQSDSSVVDYHFRVKEKPTGQLTAALGFSPGAKNTNQSPWQGQGRYSEQNESGYGWRSNVTGRWNGDKNYSLILGLENPRVNDSYWSLGGQVFWIHEARYVAENITVQEGRQGGSLTLGKRLFEEVRGSVTYKYMNIDQESDSFVFERFVRDGTAISLIFALTRDDTNDYIDPSEGSRTRVAQRVTGGPYLGGDWQLFESEASAALFVPVDFTDTYRTYFRFNSEIGLLSRYGDKPIPFLERYRMGGPDDLRGYRFQSRGPISYIRRAPGEPSTPIGEGGTKRLLFQLEYFFPIIPDANIKGLFFTDVGRVFDDNEGFSLNNMDRDVGFGFRWITPIAPFRFEWGFPVENGKLGPAEFHFLLGF